MGALTDGGAAATSSFDWSAVFAGFRPVLPLLIGILLVVAVLRSPMPGRGPGFQRRDPWRSFKFEARRAVLDRAGHRCEGAVFLVWGRCRQAAAEVDHIYPWSKGGATIVSNGQALCRDHNRAKASWSPPWWYTLTLERRRRAYFPAGADVRVFAVMSDADRASRASWGGRRLGRR